MDGPLWKEEDRQIIYTHAVLRPRDPASGLLQEKASGQRGEKIASDSHVTPSDSHVSPVFIFST